MFCRHEKNHKRSREHKKERRKEKERLGDPSGSNLTTKLHDSAHITTTHSSSAVSIGPKLLPSTNVTEGNDSAVLKIKFTVQKPVEEKDDSVPPPAVPLPQPQENVAEEKPKKQHKKEKESKHKKEKNRKDDELRKIKTQARPKAEMKDPTTVGF